MDGGRLQHSGNEGGFTLFEVVVAIALLGLILAASFGLLGVGLRSMWASREYTWAVLLARQKLQEISLRTPEDGFADQGSDRAYLWSAEIMPEEHGGEELPAQLFQLRVRVSWAGRAKEKSVEMVTLAASFDEEKLAGTVMPESERGRPNLGGASRVSDFSSPGKSLRSFPGGSRR